MTQAQAPRRCAVVDIGSNSVRLMVADVDGAGRLEPTLKQLHTTRMAQGMDATGCLSDPAMDRTAQAVADFLRTTRQAGARRVFAFATAAVREAANREEFIRRLHRVTTVLPEVLTEEREALAGFVGSGAQGGHGVIDIGGASTELAVGEGWRMAAWASLKLGAVRLSERYPLGDVADPLGLEAMGQAAAAVLNPPVDELREAACGLPPICWRGVGGTITTLAAMALQMPEYDGRRIQDYPLPLEAVAHWQSWLAALPLSERRAIAGLPPQRADIILAGVVILRRFMESMGVAVLQVSDRDNLEGYLLLKLKEEGLIP